MDSPTTPAGTEGGDSTTRLFGSRSSVIDSIRGCGLPGAHINKDDLKAILTIPGYLRVPIRVSITAKDPTAGLESYWNLTDQTYIDADPPEGPIFVFINPNSGGRHGPELKHRLLDMMGYEQVLDLSEVNPHDFVRFGLGCLDRIVELGDQCARETRRKIRIMVAGGDGSVGWVLGSISNLLVEGRDCVPPVGIIPLGTGNDLSRTFGWGGSFPFAWKSAIKRTLLKAVNSPVLRLDSWKLLVSLPSGEVVDPPHSLGHSDEQFVHEGFEIEGKVPKNVNNYEGVFYNYFSIGMDARVAYDFHHLRNEKPYLAQSPIANKIIYSGYSCSQGWFLTHCINDPSLRGLKNILRLHIKKRDSSEWELIPIPRSVRAIVVLNLHNYGSGRNPWGHLSSEYMERRGFVEASVEDGLVEIFGLKQGWHASLVMVELISAKHIAQAASIRMELRGGQWKDAYMQMDGEPWKQPLSCEYSSFLEISRVPSQSLMLSGF